MSEASAAIFSYESSYISPLSYFIVNYLYLETLPLEFFWLANFSSYLGGSSVYYLAYYAYGSAITDQVHNSGFLK